MTCNERELRGDKMTAEQEADDNIAWMMEYFKGCGHNNSWAMLGHLIDIGVLNIVLTLMAMSLLSERLARLGSWMRGWRISSLSPYGWVMSHSVFGRLVLQ